MTIGSNKRIYEVKAVLSGPILFTDVRNLVIRLGLSPVRLQRECEKLKC